MMGRMKDSEIGRSLSRRLDSKNEPTPGDPAPEPSSSAEARPTALKKRARDGMHYIGFHVSEDQFERLRVIAFETRKEKQALMREGLETILKKYGG